MSARSRTEAVPAWGKVLDAAVAYTRQRDRAPGSASTHERDLEHAILDWIAAREGWSPPFMFRRSGR